MKKTKKSLRATIITFIVGIIIPKFFHFASTIVIDKLIWKGLLCGAFKLATCIVGLLYSCKIINGRAAGGKTRIVLFLVFVFALIPLSQLLFPTVEMIIKIAFAFATGILLISLLRGIFKVFTFFVDESDSENTYIQQQRIETRHPTTKSKIEAPKLPAANPISITQQSKQTDLPITEEKVHLFTLFELAWQHDFSQGPLMVTNDENPNLKWIKICHAPYGDGKIYGYIMMNRARKTVDGEIYFANRAIWQVI